MSSADHRLVSGEPGRTLAEVFVSKLNAGGQMRHRGHVGSRPVAVLRVVGCVLPRRRRAPGRSRPQCCRPCPGGVGDRSSVQPQEVRRKWSGIVSRMFRMPGKRSSAGGRRPHVIRRVAVVGEVVAHHGGIPGGHIGWHVRNFDECLVDDRAGAEKGEGLFGFLLRSRRRPATRTMMAGVVEAHARYTARVRRLEVRREGRPRR